MYDIREIEKKSNVYLSTNRFPNRPELQRNTDLKADSTNRFKIKIKIKEIRKRRWG